MTASSTILTAAHNQWRDRPSDQRFQTLADLKDSVAARRLRSRSTDINLGKVHAEVVDDAVVLNSAISPVNTSNWSFGQLAGQIGAPAGYLRKLPARLVADNINHGLTVNGNADTKFMTVASEDGALGTLQAVTSTTYGRIWDADVVSAVERIVEGSNGRFHNPKAYLHNGQGLGGLIRDPATGGFATVPSGLYASDRDVFMFMIDGGSLLDAGPRAQLNRGFFVWNSEVGAKTFGLTTFLFNTVCGNNLVYGATDINELIIRHSSGGPARFDRDATPALMKFIDSSAETECATIRRAQDFLLNLDAKDPMLTLNELSTRAKVRFTKTELQEAINFAQREEGKVATLWDFQQGLTAYARGFDFIDAKTDLERRAGQLLKLVSNT